jgi:hypothetical protein
MAQQHDLEPAEAAPERGLRAEPVAIRWDPTLPVFAKPEFLESVSDEYGWLGGVDGSGTQRCLLPYTLVRKAGIRMIRFRVETIPCGGPLDVDEERSFLNSAVECFRSAGADVIIPASTNAIFRTYPDAAVAAPYGTYVVSLEQSEDALWAAVSATHRRHIRSATKSGVRIRAGFEDTALCHRIIRETFGRSRIPFMGLTAFDRLLTGLSGQVGVFVAEHLGRVQSCAIIAFSQCSAYYMYGGSAPDAIPGAMHLLHWEAMRHFRQEGVHLYDFYGARVRPTPGSKAAGLATFKERFGATLREGYIWKYRISRVRSLAYTLAVRCLRRGDIVDAERHKLHPPAASAAPCAEACAEHAPTPRAPHIDVLTSNPCLPS